MNRCLKIVLVAALLFGSIPAVEGAGEITMGALFDLTGPTSDVGWHYADGARDYVRYVNEEKGGVGNGVKIKLNWVDYQYKIPQAIAAYAKFVKRDRVVAIIGFGTGDSEALKTKIVKDQVPYISASFSQHLVWPAKWNFLPVVTYADQIRIVMKHIRSEWDKPGNPKMAIIYNDTGYGRAPLEPAKLYAREIGIDLVGIEVVGLQDLEATSQLLRIKEKAVDFVFIQETFVATSTILKDAKRLGLKDVIFTGNFWGTGKKLTELAGKAAEGYLGIMPFSIWSDKGEGIEFAHMLNAKYHPEVKYRESQYIAGLVNAMIMVKAVEDALKVVEGDPSRVTGKSVFDALEAMKD
ncbi:MAG: ABC transporter substrate-binding protein, partial [Candidatus Latescibacteria bacterium]|nr:ABC transporter substrate-binding protein [Candidatus Latescibacterota bacterium]